MMKESFPYQILCFLASATAGNGIFMIDLVGKKETEVCIDLYGVLLSAKYTRMECK